MLRRLRVMSSIEAFRRNLRLAVEASAIEVATTAKMEHRYKQRESQLMKAVRIKPDEPSMEKHVYLDGNVVPYAVFIHEGIKPHDIFPKRRKALRWVDGVTGKRFLYAKRVRFPGWDPDPFIYDAFESNQETIINIFDRYTERALREVEDAITSRRITG